MISKGYVGLFRDAITTDHVRTFILSWMERFEKVEQVCPGKNAGAITVHIKKLEDLLEDPTPQFRVLQGSDFTWVYVTKGKHTIETTGLPADGISLCLDVLLELPGVTEIIDQHDDRRLDQLEAEGLM